MARTFDLSEAPDTVEFSPLPAGNYLVDIAEREETTVKGINSPNYGKEQIRWTLSVSEGEHAGRLLFFYTLLDGENPDSLRNLKNLLLACGYERHEIESGAFTVDFDDLIGKNVGATVIQRTYEGSKVNGVRRLLPADEVASSSSLLPS